MGFFEIVGITILAIFFGIFAITMALYTLIGSGIKHGDEFDHEAEIRRLEINLGNEKDFRKRSEIEGMISSLRKR